MAPHFNDVTNAAECELFFADLSSFTDLSSVADCTAAFRNTFGSKYAKGFLFDIATIDQLRAQNGGNVSGIRIYLGLDSSSGTTLPTAVAVAVVNNADLDIPTIKTGTTTSVLAEGRPCPAQCGPDNALNN